MTEEASRTGRRGFASLAAAAVLALLVAGLVPVWALALQTPFRLIDDYGAYLPLERQPAASLLREAFSLQQNPARFRPTHDLGQLLCWRLFGGSAAAHHALRLVMKVLAFIAFVAVARREVARAAGRSPDGAQAVALLALGVALFFYLPNNPEARLAPQELAMTLYLLGALFFVAWRTPAAAPVAADALFFICFTLALWSKEPAFMPAAPLLALAWLRTGDPPRRVSMPFRLCCLAVWLHAAAKALVMSAGGGYGRPPLTAASLRKMAASVPSQVLLTGSVPWLGAVFLAGAVLCAWHQLARPAQGRRRAWVVWAMLAGAVLQYLLLWEVVLRYAFPVTVLLSLVTLIGFAAAMATAAPATVGRWALGVTALALALAATSYGHMAAQFAMQQVAGRGEQAALLGAEQASREMNAVLHLTRTSEHTYRAEQYFTEHLPRFEGRVVACHGVRLVGDVPARGLLLARDAIPDRIDSRRVPPDGFQVLARWAAPDPPAILRWAEAVSRGARLGRPLAAPPVDAGAPGLQPPPWYLLRRRER